MVKHLRDGENFGPSHFSKDFGFHGSTQTGPRARVKPHTRGLPKPAPAPMQDPIEPDVDDMPMARGGSSGLLIHPMGHDVTHVTSGPSCMIQHHAHGGCTVVHDDGRVEHQRAGVAEGGDVSDDDTDLNLARGGAMKAMRRVLGARTRLPPNQRPPKNPTVTPTPTNDMPGGQMGYGVQPSDESGMMGGPGESAVPMRKGGKKR